MLLNILVFTAANETPTVNATAISDSIANIVIHAPSMEDAHDLLDQGENLARCAMANWTTDAILPAAVTQQDKDDALYKVSTVSEQALDKTIAEYEATPAGKRLPRSVDIAHLARRKAGHDPSGAEFGYMVARAHKDPWNAMYDYYDLAFKRGYEAAIRSQKTKQERRQA